MSSINWIGDPTDPTPPLQKGLITYGGHHGKWNVIESGIFGSFHIEGVWIWFDPQPDITTYELALLQKIHYSGTHIDKKAEELKSLNLMRHYKMSN